MATVVSLPTRSLPLGFPSQHITLEERFPVVAALLFSLAVLILRQD
jgi:hypothetical protein